MKTIKTLQVRDFRVNTIEIHNIGFIISDIYGYYNVCFINADGSEDWWYSEQVPPYTEMMVYANGSVEFVSEYHTPTHKGEHGETIWDKERYNEAFLYSRRFQKWYHENKNLFRINQEWPNDATLEWYRLDGNKIIKLED